MTAYTVPSVPGTWPREVRGPKLAAVLTEMVRGITVFFDRDPISLAPLALVLKLPELISALAVRAANCQHLPYDTWTVGTHLGVFASTTGFTSGRQQLVLTTGNRDCEGVCVYDQGELLPILAVMLETGQPQGRCGAEYPRFAVLRVYFDTRPAENDTSRFACLEISSLGAASSYLWSPYLDASSQVARDQSPTSPSGSWQQEDNALPGGLASMGPRMPRLVDHLRAV